MVSHVVFSYFIEIVMTFYLSCLSCLTLPHCRAWPAGWVWPPLLLNKAALYQDLPPQFLSTGASPIIHCIVSSSVW